jgi:hypothetical protein|tara:strand:- start:451 stop:2067 length:1617 start_codon:yes stop_codon:yes gene_type:complete
MMNVLQVQDNLKNFSQDQLIKEMQQPSGNTPQFLVLSELNRRKRVKGDFEARQASTQQTVAQDAVASAGVPQEGMMGMSEAMAPASAESEGIGSMMPKSMRNGGEVDRYADGGLIEGIAESVGQNSEMLQQVSQNMGKMNTSPFPQPSVQLPPQQPSVSPINSTFRPPLGGQVTDMRRPLNGFGGSPFNRGGPPLGFGGKGGQRAGRDTYGRPSEFDSTFKGLGSFADIFNKVPAAEESKAMAEGGVIRAADGLPEYKGFGKLGSDTRGDSFRRPNDPTITDDFEQTGNVDVGGLFGFGQPTERSLQEIIKTGPKTMDELEILEQSELQTEKQTPLVTAPEIAPEKKPEQKLIPTSTDEEKPLTIEQELLKRQADLEKNKNSDKWMALAQAGLAIMGSNNPNLAGAIGEGGTAGLTAFSDSNKRYQEGLTDILNARAKMQTARLTAAGKGRLTRSSAIQAINTYNTAISSKEKQISDLIEGAGVYGADMPEGIAKQIAELKASIADLQYQQSQLFGAGKIRPRPSVNVKGLPSAQKAS